MFLATKWKLVPICFSHPATHPTPMKVHFQPSFGLQSKSLFSKIFLAFTNELKTYFENKKSNYPNREWNYFSYFLTSNQKTSFTKCFKLLLMSLKLVVNRKQNYLNRKWNYFVYILTPIKNFFYNFLKSFTSKLHLHFI